MCDDLEHAIELQEKIGSDTTKGANNVPQFRRPSSIDASRRIQKVAACRQYSC